MAHQSQASRTPLCVGCSQVLVWVSWVTDRTSAQTCDPSIPGAKAGVSRVFEARLGYMVNFRSVWPVEGLNRLKRTFAA